jgi:DNA-binding transcriptional LysR family regulator
MKDSDTPELTSRQPQAVAALAEFGSFIAAAALLRTSQPAVTRTVKHVGGPGIRLFDGSTRSARSRLRGRNSSKVATRVLNDLRITINRHARAVGADR